MSATICIDFGNTRCKAAVFVSGTIARTSMLSQDPREGIRNLLDEYAPQNSILSSVINHDATIEEMLADRTHFHKLNHKTILPFSTPVSRPETIGADRLAICAAAVNKFPGCNNLAIGLGSCVTYNFINKKNEFIGGAISPGLAMRLRSMHEFTAKLPLVKADWNVPVIGYDTNSNLLAGAVIGMANEIDGFIELYAEKFGNFNVLLTGGDIVHLGSHLKKKIFADPELIFKGLYAISEVNNP